MPQIGIYWNNNTGNVAMCYDCRQRSWTNVLKVRGYYTSPLATRDMISDEISAADEVDTLILYQYHSWQELLTDEYAQGFTRDHPWIKSIRRLMEMPQYSRAKK